MERGRPSDYDPRHIEDMLKFFQNWEEYIIEEVETASAGRVVKIKQRKPNVPPTLNRYAISIGTDRNTLKRWADQNPDFRSTYDACKAIQEEFLSVKGLMGEYNSAITKMMLVNHSGLRDRVEHDVSDDLKKTIQIKIDQDDSSL